MKLPTATRTKPAREVLAPLLLRRFWLLTFPVVVGSVAFGSIHIWLQEPQLGVLLGLNSALILHALFLYWLATRRPTREIIVGGLLLLGASTITVTAITGVIIGEVQTNALLYVVVTLTACSFIPWGAAAQTVLVVSATAAAVSPLIATDSSFHQLVHDLASLSITFFLSIYIARETERETLANHQAQAASRELAESRADFEGLFRSSNVLLAMLEPTEDDFAYADLNSTLAGVFGHSVDSMQGMTGRQLGFSEAEIVGWRDLLGRCAIAGSATISEYELTVIDPPRWYQVSLSAIRDELGNTKRFSSVSVDITELKRASEYVRNLNLNLERQVRDRTSLLEAANHDLESFAYSVSHDLRTPLRSIEGFSAMLSDDHCKDLSVDAVHLLDRIRHASRHMAQLIDDILTLSRAGRTPMKRETVNLSALAHDVALDVRAARAGRNVGVVVEPNLRVNGDERLLRIVLTNLLDNAWKYTGLREDAHIEVGRELRDGDLVFYVRDNGCGFDMKFVEKLFKPFQRLHSAEEYDGTGVGLATVARIIQRHGGRVWTEGRIDHGATFYFTVGEDGAAPSPVAPFQALGS